MLIFATSAQNLRVSGDNQQARRGPVEEPFSTGTFNVIPYSRLISADKGGSASLNGIDLNLRERSHGKSCRKLAAVEIFALGGSDWTQGFTWGTAETSRFRNAQSERSMLLCLLPVRGESQRRRLAGGAKAFWQRVSRRSRMRVRSMVHVLWNRSFANKMDHWCALGVGGLPKDSGRSEHLEREPMDEQ